MFGSILYDVTLCWIVLLTILYLFLKDRYGFFRRRGISYCEPVFLLGSTWRNVIGMENLIDSCHRIYVENEGKPYLGIFQGLTPTIFLRDPHLIEKVFIKEFSNFHDRGIPTDEEANPLEGSLFNLKGSKWRALRNKLIPSFSSSKLKGMLSTMQSSIDLFLNEFQQHEDQVIEMKSIFTRLNLHIIGTCAFGLDLDTIKNPDSKFPQICKKVFIRDPVTFVKGVIRFFFPKFAKFFRFRMIDKETNDFIMDLVKDTFDHREKEGVKRNDFLQILLELKQKGKIELDDRDNDEQEKFIHDNVEDCGTFELTDEVLAAQAFVFYSGGFETTSTALSFTFYLLSKNQNEQDKLRQEIILTKKKYGNFSYEALKSMAYTEACINESLRLYPPVGVLVRKCNKHTVLQQKDTIEKDMLVFISTYSIQRDEKYFTEPLSFKPERFINPTTSSCVFLPFGDGPRNCIAKRFAYLVMKATIAEILIKYKVNTCSKMSSLEPIQLRPRAFITTPKDGLHCVLSKLPE